MSERAARAKVRVGHGKIDVSRTENRGAIGLTNKDKLRLAKSGVKDLLEGTKSLNRLRLNQGTDKSN